MRLQSLASTRLPASIGCRGCNLGVWLDFSTIQPKMKLHFNRADGLWMAEWE